MVIANIQIENKSGKPRFFQKTFLVANNQFEVILGMLFLKLATQTCHLVKKQLCRSLKSPTWPYPLLSKSKLLI